MEYKFLVDTYDSERLKILSVWSNFRDDDITTRPDPANKKGRNALEQMVHQCLGENNWFINMFGIDVDAPPLPEKETRLDFIKRYAEDSGKRCEALKVKDKEWWDTEVDFFDVKRSRAWILVRRIAHTAQHRGQLITLLRILGRELHSVYGPTADTGGLPKNDAKTIYAYPDIKTLIEGELAGGRKSALPGPGNEPCTERPQR